MQPHSDENHPAIAGDRWLKTYYFIRAVVALAWVALAFTLGRSVPLIAAVLLVAYPAWDALANFLDAQRSGGLVRNKSQMLNMGVSILTAVGVAAVFGTSMSAVLGVFGIWATFAGLLQLATAIRRWKFHGAQWAMILSGAQSALAGIVFIKWANGATVPAMSLIAAYAASGAFYFLVSAVWLTVKTPRSGRPEPVVS